MVSLQIVDPMHGHGDYDLVDHLTVAQIVVCRYHTKGRRRWIMHMYLMLHVVTPMLMESPMAKK